MIASVHTLERNAPRIRLRSAALMCGLLVATLVLAACGGQTATTRTATLPVSRGDVVQSVSGSGSIEPLRESFLNFVTNGTVNKVLVEEGQQVKQGTVLASL